MDPILEMYQALEEKVLAYNPNLNKGQLFSAFQYADKAHAGQVRRDGSPYITHPLQVAMIVADFRLDTETVMAALLHDCIEDTGSTYDEIARLFGEPVADLVDGVTKLTKMNFSSLEQKQSENLRKMLLAMSKDIRVVLVKLCDRLHNMRTMQYQSPKKQREKSSETLEIYAPIAHRLGMQRLKWELEDLSIKYLDPVGYTEIEQQLNERSSFNHDFLDNMKMKLQTEMNKAGISCTITGRVKHVYSIYRKMHTQHKALDEIFDLYALRIIVDTVQDCYNALGIVHSVFNLVPGRFKDYISTPKPNLYKSLHTTVIGREGIPFEVQIRTWEMHETAEYGIAAHWKYKQGYTNAASEDEHAYEWIRRLLENQESTDAEEFVKGLKIDMYSDEVFVFTPTGELKSLPSGSTPIDFAYAIHSAIGNSMIGAKVNNRLVPFSTTLNNGDICDILTSKAAKGPSRDWLNICKSNQAKTKIRQWFKKERRQENIVTGRASFEAELKRIGYSLTEITAPDALPRILKKVQYSSLDDMYAAIGYGGTTSVKMIARIHSEMTAIIKDRKAAAAQLEAERKALDSRTESMHVKTVLEQPDAEIDAAPRKKITANGIIVEGVDNCLVKLAKCCAPVPGDPIIGFITKGFGVSIHRTDCPNAAPERRQENSNRWVSVEWCAAPAGKYRTALDITAEDRNNLFLDIASCLSNARVEVNSLVANGLPDGFAVVKAVVSVKDRYELDMVMRKLAVIRGVMNVERPKS